MRINSVSSAYVNPRNIQPIKRDAAVPPDATASGVTAAPASKARAHGVIKKLGTDHYSPAVEAKLAARFAPERLAPPATDPATDPVIDPPQDPVLDPALDPVLDPQIIPSDETPTELTPLPENELAPDTQIGGDAAGDAPLTRDALLARTTTSAFANFNLLDFTQQPHIDLVA